VNPEVLLSEVAELQKRNIDTSRLFVSDRANMIMPYHVLMDGLEEKSRGGDAIRYHRPGHWAGLLGQGGPDGHQDGRPSGQEALPGTPDRCAEDQECYPDQVYGMEPLSVTDIYDKYQGYVSRLAPMIKETDVMLHDYVSRNEIVLFEGAQGTLLDTDFGTYPYVTSSSPMAGNACSGSGIPPRAIDVCSASTRPIQPGWAAAPW